MPYANWRQRERFPRNFSLMKISSVSIMNITLTWHHLMNCLINGRHLRIEKIIAALQTEEHSVRGRIYDLKLGGELVSKQRQDYLERERQLKLVISSRDTMDKLEFL